MAEYFTIAESSINGRRRRWTVEVRRWLDVAPAAVEHVDLSRNLVLEYGSSSAEMYDLIMPSALRCTFIDPMRVIITAANDIFESADDPPLHVVLESDDGAFQWEGIILFETIRESLSRAQAPQLDVYAACGMASLDKLPVVADTEDFLYEIYRNILQRSLSMAPVEMSTPLSNRLVPDGIGINSRISIPELSIIPPNPRFGIRLRRPRSESLAVASQTLVQRTWRGINGVWHLRNLATLGRAARIEKINEDGSLSYADRTGEAAQTEITLADLEDGSILMAERHTRSLDITTEIDNKRYRRGFVGDHISHVYLLDGTFTSWNAGGDPYGWDFANVIEDSRGNPPHAELTGTSCARFEDSTIVLEEGLMSVQGGDEIYLSIEFDFALYELPSQPVGDGIVRFEVTIEPTPGSDMTVPLFLDAEGRWISTSELATEAVTVENTDVINWHAANIRSIDPIPGDGTLILRFLGTSSYETLLDNLDVQVINSAETENEIPEQITFTSTYGNEQQDGNHLSWERPFSDAIKGPGFAPASDPDPLPGEVGYPPDPTAELQISIFDQSGIHRPPGLWTGEVSLIESTLTDLQAQYVLAAQGIRRRLEARVLHLLGPGQILLFEGLRLLMLRARIDLVEEITDGEWIEQPELP